MLKSLFGDLPTSSEQEALAGFGVGSTVDGTAVDAVHRGAAGGPRAHAAHDAALLRAHGFAQLRREVLGDDGRLLVQDDDELIVRGAPAQAMRMHLMTVERRESVRMLTVADTGDGQATQLVRGLAHATGEPLQRLRLRDQVTQRVLLALERTQIPRRGDTTLKLYHVALPHDDAGTGFEDAALAATSSAVDTTTLHANDPATDLATTSDSDLAPFVLMESSDMAVLFVGPSTSPLVFDQWLAKLYLATQSMTWRCPTLVFFRTHDARIDAQTMHGTVDAVDWPSDLRVVLLEDIDAPSTAAGPTAAANTETPRTSMAARWNALLGAWDQHEMPLVGQVSADRDDAVVQTRAVARQLRQLMGTSGIVAAAVAHIDSGLLVGGESHQASVDMPRLAQAFAVALRSHQEAAKMAGSLDALEEIVLTAGGEQYIVRPLRREGTLFLMARLQRAHSNLTVARLKVAEAQRHLDG